MNSQTLTWESFFNGWSMSMLAAVGAFYVAQPLQAAPQGAEVVQGSAAITRNGAHTRIDAANNTIINYQQFDVAAHESVRFVQPNSQSRVLNRVVGGNASTIAGRIDANGIVYIANPNGIYFANGAQINANSLYAIAGHLSDADFLSGIDRFDLTGSITNEGVIVAENIHLIGNSVANFGTLEANGGIITMVAGDEVILKQQGGRFSVTVDGTNLSDATSPAAGQSQASTTGNALVTNEGTARSAGGSIFLGAGDMASLAIANRGQLTAAGGKVDMVARDGAIVNEGTVDVSVDQGQAGSVRVSGPSLVNFGAIHADSNSGQAGEIVFVSQNHTFLMNGSTISAAGGSGAADGGYVLIHSYNGQTRVEPGALIDLTSGALGGNGGFVEVSGKYLGVQGDVLVSGIESNGTFYLDPLDIIIRAGGPGVGEVDGNALAADGVINLADAPGDILVVDPAVLEAAGGAIILEADRDIIVEDQLMPLFEDVTLTAANDVIFNAPILAAGSITVNAGGEIIFDYGFLPMQALGPQQYNGNVFLANHSSLEGTVIEFNGTVETASTSAVARILTIIGSADFRGQVGGAIGSPTDSILSSVSVSGATNIWGGSVRTQFQQTYTGDVTLNDHTTFQALNDEIVFSSLIQDGRVNQGFADPADMVVDANVVFGYRITSQALAFDPPAIPTAPGARPVRLVGSLLVTGDTEIQGDFLTTLGDQTYQGRVFLRDDDNPATPSDPVVITSYLGDITFENFVDSYGFPPPAVGPFEARGLVVVAETGDVNFNANVGVNGGVVPLDFLDVYAGVDLGGVITFGGDTVTVNDRITFNRLGATVIPEVASIAATNPGGITFVAQSLNGEFFVGENNKLTALGPLNIVAGPLGGRVTLGDTNANGLITVFAPNIDLWARVADDLRNSSNALISDNGPEIISPTGFDFLVTPVVVGAGNAPVFGTNAPAAVADVNGTIDGYFTIFDDILPITAGDFTRPQSPSTLDLTLRYPGAGGGGGGAVAGAGGASAALLGIGADIADEIPDNPEQFEDRLAREPIVGPEQQQALRELLAVDVEGLNSEEFAAHRDVHKMYMDMVLVTDQQDEARVTVNRLKRDLALSALNRVDGVLRKSTTDDQTGQTRLVDQKPVLADALAAAYQAYTEGEANPSPEGFVRYLSATPAHATLLADMSKLQMGLAELKLAGLTDAELTAAVNAVFGPMMPQGMTAADFYQALGGSQLAMK